MNPTRTVSKGVRDGAGTIVAATAVIILNLFVDLTVEQAVGLTGIGAVLDIGVIRLLRDLWHGSPS